MASIPLRSSPAPMASPLARGASRRSRAAAAALGLLWVLSGCDQGSGHLTGEHLEVLDCQRLSETTRFEPFSLELAFLGVNEARGAVIMRMAPSAGRIDRADQLGIAISESDELALASHEGPRTFELRPDGTGEAELTLALLGRCRFAAAPLVAVGAITFERWGWKNGERVRGTMAFDVADRRTGAIVGRGFVGEFDFESQTGQPYTPFAPRDF